MYQEENKNIWNDIIDSVNANKKKETLNVIIVGDKNSGKK